MKVTCHAQNKPTTTNLGETGSNLTASSNISSESKHCSICSEQSNLGTLKDSGSRRRFESGAVRDIAIGKGRMDLMPWEVMSKLVKSYYEFMSKTVTEEDIENYSDDVFIYCKVLDIIHKFLASHNVHYLYDAAVLFIQYRYQSIYDAILELSVHFEDGAKKYGEHNWEKGIPVHCYIDSGLRHLTKYFRGDKDEPHDRAFLWNVVCGIYTIQNVPDMMDICSSYEPDCNPTDQMTTSDEIKPD